MPKGKIGFYFGSSLAVDTLESGTNGGTVSADL